jgi:DNA mismatch repair protein MutS
MALIKEYFELTEKYKNEYGERTIVLIQCGSFMEVYAMISENKESKGLQGLSENNYKQDSIYGSSIVDFSQVCELNIVRKNTCVGNNPIVMAGFKDIMLEKYLKKLQESGFTTVVIKQDENAKNTTRSLLGIFSPGTYFNTDESSKLNNNISCIWIEKIENKILNKGIFVYIGVSNINILTGKTNVFEFKELYANNPTTYDQLERFVSIYKPSEAIILSNLPSKEIDSIIDFANIQSQSIRKVCLIPDGAIKEDIQLKRAINCQKQIYQKEILERFYDINHFFIQPYIENIYSTQSLCFLLDFVYQHNPYLVKKISEPEFENCSDYLVLSNHSLKQLNIIDDNNYSGKCSSVIKLLNLCFTPMGKRLFYHLIVSPTKNIEYLEREYNMTECVIDNYDKTYENVKQLLMGLKDLSKWNRQIYIKKISPKCFYQMYTNLKNIQSMYLFLSKSYSKIPLYSEYFKTKVENIKKIDSFCSLLTEIIERNINIEVAKDNDQYNSFEDNFINPGIDKELDEKISILKNSTEKLESIKNYFNSLVFKFERKSRIGGRKTEKKNFDNTEETKCESSKTEYFKIHETEKNNFSLIGTKRRATILKKILENEKSIYLKYSFSTDTKDTKDTKERNETNEKNETNNAGFVFDCDSIELINQSANNNSIYNPQINELCRNINNIKLQLKDIISRVYQKFIEKMENYQKEIDSVLQFATWVDIIYTKATIAIKYNYCKPVLDKQGKKGYINAENLRHVLIEHIQQDEIYVSNDISNLGKERNGMLLYGVNAVGKTSLIKALGISLLMAQSGLYVPASNYVYYPYNSIFTRILGNDNIFKGLSTFEVEMNELRNILKNADENSLILGDELCSGTESVSAISLFVAGIQELCKKNSSFIFATHLHEIVNYDEILELEDKIYIKHMKVIYDKEKDMLIYDRKLREGSGDNMYGLEVCKSLNLSSDFLDRANNIRMKYFPNTQSILSLKTSHYNSQKLMSLCEICKINIGVEVHHLQHQKEADLRGIIKTEESTFHKNIKANLMTLCEACHNRFHSLEINQKKKNGEKKDGDKKDGDKKDGDKKERKVKQHIKVKTSNGYLLQNI